MVSNSTDWIYMSPAIIVLFVNILFLVKIMWVSRPLFPLLFPRVALSTWRQQTKRTRPTRGTRPAPRASQTADRSAVSLRFSADWFRVIVRRKNSINDQIRQRKTCETWSNRRQQKNVFNCIRSRVRYWGCSSPRRPAAAFRDAESKYIQHSRDRPGY